MAFAWPDIEKCQRLELDTPHVTLDEVPIPPPLGSGPFELRDGHKLTPIEAPFYDAVRETGTAFAVQPFVMPGSRS